jgi:glyoxylate/hydroxypyruvate reductase
MTVMPTTKSPVPHLHFETRADKPRVFRITSDLIEAAKKRNDLIVSTSLGEAWNDLTGLSQAVGLVTAADLLADAKFPRRALERAAPKLRWIHVTGAGIEPLLPLDWLPKQVAMTNNSGVHIEKVRESAMMLLLMLNARIPAIATNQRKSNWQQIFSPRIHGRTVLIVGVGRMGGAVAQTAKQLGLYVIGVRRSGARHAYVDEMFKPDEIDLVLPKADFVVLTAPLTDETAMLLDAGRVARMKKGAGFLNMGRAGAVDHDALAAALKNNSLAGAILDVFDPEPLPPGSPLWNCDGLMVIPHVTSDDEDNYLPKTLDLAFENFRRLLDDDELINVVDPRRQY